MPCAHASALANQSPVQAKVCIKQKSLIRRGNLLTEEEGSSVWEGSRESLRSPVDRWGSRFPELPWFLTTSVSIQVCFYESLLFSCVNLGDIFLFVIKRLLTEIQRHSYIITWFFLIDHKIIGWMDLGGQCIFWSTWERVNNKERWCEVT